VADAVLTYHNANGLGAPGAGKGYLRDVALVTSDIHALSETSWDEAQVKVLTEAMQNGGHRLWANTAKTRSVAKSGTAILARSTIAPCKGDGELWSKPDGKALAVALTVQGQPIVLLAAHLPHTDPERVSFLREVADGLEAAVAAHVLTADGAPWSRALYLWAGDLNLTCHPTLDNETPKPAPTPEVVKALTRLNRVMGGAVDVYRTLHPKGRAYTHGTVEKGLIKPGSRRRLDAWWAQPTALKGPTGVVSARLVHKERAGFSYTHAHTRKERFKESDHDAVQIVLRGALIPKPQPRTTLRLDTLRDPAVRAAMGSHLAEAGDQNADTADGLWHSTREH
jgi:exonuclease III